MLLSLIPSTFVDGTYYGQMYCVESSKVSRKRYG